MKKIILSLLFVSSISFAQNGINYQGAATDADGAKLVNQNISLKTSVLQGGVDGTASYSETHNTTTDQFGLFNVVIGLGNIIEGSFDSIQWGANSHFLKVELDATGGTNYSLVSTTQMMSVPYAKFAENSKIDTNAILDLISDEFDLQLNEESNTNNSFTDESIVNGSRVYYIENGNIKETDENGSFSNTLIDSQHSIVALDINNQTQELYWIEQTSNYSGDINKTNLFDFEIKNVSALIFPEYVNGDISGMSVHDETVYFTTGDYLLKTENSVTTQLVDASTNVYDVDVDNDGNIFYTQNGKLMRYYPASDETPYPSTGVVASINDIKKIDCSSSNESRIYYSKESNGNRIIESVDYDGNSGITHMNFTFNNLDFRDIKIKNNSEFYIGFQYTLAKYDEIDDLKHFMSNGSSCPGYICVADSLLAELSPNFENDSISNNSNYNIIYIENGNIIKTDENRSFSNTLVDSQNEIIAFDINKNTQVLYWIEQASNYSGSIKKSNLNNFNVEFVSAYTSPVYLNGDISGMSVHNETVYFTTGDYLLKTENSVTTQLVNASTNVYDVDVDNDGNIFYTQSGKLMRYYPASDETPYPSTGVVASINDIKKIDCSSSNESRIYYSKESNGNRIIESVDYDGNSGITHMNITFNNLTFRDIKIKNNSEFYIGFEYTLSRFDEETSLQNIISTGSSNRGFIGVY